MVTAINVDNIDGSFVIGFLSRLSFFSRFLFGSLESSPFRAMNTKTIGWSEGDGGSARRERNGSPHDEK